ncbi:hypothetical protein NDU88_008298 [Pleurodeles waltl]|uniref:Uncharacterized protein n=1 Tax=Pleurodeles waltl TaxID=8319 RepID=A0AAV7RWG9_PLEWA|nr:hypothetical protein NDU88_008298 [Pleurodeles waltl]
MMYDDCVKAALQLLREARHLELLKDSRAELRHPARRVVGGVAAAVLACSPRAARERRQLLGRRKEGPKRVRDGPMTLGRSTGRA